MLLKKKESRAIHSLVSKCGEREETQIERRAYSDYRSLKGLLQPSHLPSMSLRISQLRSWSLVLFYSQGQVNYLHCYAVYIVVLIKWPAL